MSDKNRLLTLLLAVFFGVFGAHRFYAGKTDTALLMVVLDLTMVGFVVTGIWSWIDVIFIACGEFTDADGLKIVDWQM